MRLLSSICLLLYMSGTAIAQVRIDDRDALLEYADKHAPMAKQAQIQALIAADDRRLASSALYPKINGFSTADYYPLIPTQVIPAEVIGGKPGTFIKAQFGLPYVLTAGAELSIPVISLEKWSQLAKARTNQQKAEWTSKAALENFHIQLLGAYYQILVAKEIVKLNEENTQTADELLHIIDERNKQGIVEPSVNNRTHNLQLDIKTSGINSQLNLQQGINSLKSVLSLMGDSLVLSESLTDFTWPVLLAANSAAARPAWQEANLNVRIAELALSESRNGMLPRLSLNSRYAYNFQTKLESGGQNVEFNVANIGLRLDVPLFQGLYYRTWVHKNKLQLEYAKLAKQIVQDTLEKTTDNWFVQYKTAYNKQAILKDKVATATENLRIANLNMKEGVMEFDEYNNIFVEYNRARIEYLQNLSDGILYYLLSTENY